MKIFIVGDLHGDWASLNTLINKKQPDIILQCGDFGWWPSLSMKRPVIGYHKKQKPWNVYGIKTTRRDLPDTKIYWCDGNHEDYTALNPNRIKQPYEVYDNVYHCPRGSVLNINNKNILFIGGAMSTDKTYRTEGIDWFPEEDISEEDMSCIIGNDCDIDIIISHTCPSRFNMDTKYVDKIDDDNRFKLDIVLDKYKPDFWWFGHLHRYRSGNCGNTNWMCLDYPHHSGQWWYDASHLF